MTMFHRRHLQERLESPVSRNKVRLLFGARQTGKTALLREIFDGADCRFINLQESTERRRFEADPAAFSREILALPKSTRKVVIDEIQKVPALLDEVQRLYDSAPTRWQFYLTGSSARRLRTRSANLLPGRSHAFHLFPVCGWEIDRGDKDAAPEIPAPKTRRKGPKTRSSPQPPRFPTRSLDRTLLLGSLPEIRTEPRAAAIATLETYVELYLEEEIRREALVRDMGPFSVFLRLAAHESGRQVNVAQLSQESGIAASTLKNYYQVLVDTFVGYWMPVYSGRTRKRLLTTPRFFLFDTGARNAAAEVPLNDRLDSERGGRLLEHWVGLELLARAGYHGRGYRVSFWRTSYGVEVDFVWETHKADIPVEVKWTERPRPTDARHLEKFLDQYPRRAKTGLLVCRCPAPQQLTDRVRAIPWSAL